MSTFPDSFFAKRYRLQQCGTSRIEPGKVLIATGPDDSYRARARAVRRGLLALAGTTGAPMTQNPPDQPNGNGRITLLIILGVCLITAVVMVVTALSL